MTGPSRFNPGRTPADIPQLQEELEALRAQFRNLDKRLEKALAEIDSLRADISGSRKNDRQPKKRKWRISATMFMAIMSLLGITLAIVALASGFIKIN